MAAWRCLLCGQHGVGGPKSWEHHYLRYHYEREQ